MAIRIGFLTPSGANLPSVRFRVLPFVDLGRQQGLDFFWKRIPKSMVRRYSFFSRLPWADVYVVQQKLFSSLELSALRRKCGKLVFDFDDAVWTLPAHDLQGMKQRRRAAKFADRFGRQCAFSDLCIAGNRFLADKALEYQRNVSILPTGLDTDKYVCGSGGNEGDAVLVGWMGTSGNLPYLDEPMEALTPHVGPIQFSVVSNARYEGVGKDVTFWSAWSPELEVRQLQAMHIGLMPLHDTEYTRGKCGFKILQYMACGVVPVASDVGANAEIIEHGMDGFLVRKPEEWAEYVLRLAHDPDLREKMAQAARRKVVAEFDIKALADRLWRVLGV